MEEKTNDAALIISVILGILLFSMIINPSHAKRDSTYLVITVCLLISFVISVGFISKNKD